jgi:hypothetical protein
MPPVSHGRFEVVRGEHAAILTVVTKLAEIQEAILLLDPKEQQTLRYWLDETAEETPEMLAAIDEGLRSLKEKGAIPLEDVRKKIPQWVSRSG